MDGSLRSCGLSPPRTRASTNSQKPSKSTPPFANSRRLHWKGAPASPKTASSNCCATGCSAARSTKPWRRGNCGNWLLPSPRGSVILIRSLKKSSAKFKSNRQDSMGTKIQHLGVAVGSIEEAIGFWRDALGLELTDIEVVEDQGVRVAMLPIGESRIELLEATGDETPVGKFIAKRGPGIHHLCVEVNDINAKLAELKACGVRLIDQQPRT